MPGQIVIGDVHPVVEELEDCRRLVTAVTEFARETRANEIVLLGDQHHTHSVLRLEVLGLWKAAFREWAAVTGEILALVGNHDRSNDGAVHAMLAYPEVTVVDAPIVRGRTLYVGHRADLGEFIRICNDHAAATDVVVCHQAFDASKYENGYYAGDEGVPLDRIPQRLIISGHVHDPQFHPNVDFWVGTKLWHPGSPRWRSQSDANTDRAIWFLPAGGGPPVPYDTSQCCRRIVSVVIREDDIPEVPPASDLVDVRVEIHGSGEFVETQKERLRGSGARVRTFRTDTRVAKVRESEGVDRAFWRHLRSCGTRWGTPNAALVARAEQRLGRAEA
jgi:predicted phosphodiesterase